MSVVSYYNYNVFLSLSTPKTLKPTTTRLSCSSSSSSSSITGATSSSASVVKKRNRYRKLYPGEKEGITEEMRFVAMRLRNVDCNKPPDNIKDSAEEGSASGDGGGSGQTWQPSVEGFVKFLVDNKLIFETVERIVDKSEDVSYAYFRKTGLERSISLSKDLEWLSQQDISIPTPSNPGITYAKYLEELAEKSAPLFLCHFYNIYFSHVAGGQVIAKQVSEKLFEGKELQFCSWKKKDEDLLKEVRDKLNMLGEHWTRDEKNKCLREATKAFQYMSQIVRLIIL